jgi:6-phosphogluconolactonase (cycloisomerase 2 family)
VDPSQAVALVYYGNTAVGAAGVTSSNAFGTLNNYAAPTLASNFADDMLIVNKKFLYIPMGDTTVVGFTIDRSTGTLTSIPGSPFTVPGGIGSADDLTTDPLGRFLFVGSESVAAIWVFQIDQTSGALTATAGSPFTTGMASGGVSDILTVDQSGKFLYAGQLLPSAGVAGYTIDQTTGALTAMTGSPFNLNVAQIHASPKANLLLGVQEVQDGANAATDPHIYVFALDITTGVPTAVSGSPFLTLQAPFDFTISPNGNFVYVQEFNALSTAVAPMEGFALSSGTGAMASMGTLSGVPTAEFCRFDQSGIYLFCVDDSLLPTTLTVNVANTGTGAVTHGADLATSTGFPLAVTD